MAEPEMKWYVLKAISGKESKVKEHIDAGIKNGYFNGAVSQVLIPTEKVVYPGFGGKRIVKERNYLPGYVLIEANLVGEIAHRLRATPNVLGFLGTSGNPAPLRRTEVNRILGSVDDKENDVRDFIIGESVKVVDGSFSNFTGYVESVNNDKKKLTVMVKVFGRNTPLELGFMQVEKE